MTIASQALAQILAANQRFYAAFNDGDFDAMEDLWAHRAPVVCIHPGWPALIDRDEIVESWRQILSNVEGNAIRSIEPRVLVHGETAIVVCQEVLPGGLLVATNGFIREDGVWRMMHHQASPLAARAETSERPHN